MKGREIQCSCRIGRVEKSTLPFFFFAFFVYFCRITDADAALICYNNKLEPFRNSYKDGKALRLSEGGIANEKEVDQPAVGSRHDFYIRAGIGVGGIEELQ